MKKESSEFTLAASLAALQAGDLLRKGFGTHFKIKNKKGKHNLVTEYDTASQKLIISFIRKQFPRHHFLAEENVKLKTISSQEVTWIIDPLDGTINFAHGIPQFAISIAAAMGKEILSAVIYLPMTQELFIAEKGRGTFLNGSPITISATKKLENAFVATGFPYNAHLNPLHCIDRFSKMVRLGLPIRRIGSAAMDLAYVAAGRFDGFWEVGLHPWDMAAGKLLVEEAGGKVSHYDGSIHQVYGYFNLVAANSHLHAALVKLLKEDVR